MRRLKTILVSLACIFFLLLCILASITCGARSVGFENIAGALSGSDAHEAHVIAARIPRTVFGVLAGAALAVSGALMQAVTRNPIADPSILGVNTGASLFVVCGIAFFHINTGSQYIWLAFTGASATAVFVYGLASFGYGGATPLKLALAGAAAGTALQSLVNTVMLPRTQVMDQFRFWQTGSISGASWSDIRLILPYLAAGFILSLLLAPSLNTLALGDDTAAGLGLHVTRTRALAALAGVLLCAASTALAGPIGFIGLMIPHLMRLLLGPDMRKILPLSAVGGSCLLLLADVAGRILGRPGELESGIVTALAGAPVFILIIRKVKVRSL
ncbi:FecCD family ABC transporter permease [[Clostridium] hylemonae]|uniref:Iron chelate uptake ABC transporter, FeCT family, permease protein n=1 Tax=[Clostridium] hylemonae DSM 15053 TaxID=553973 RepID=C0BYG7_9FIRM|nr:iron ABC transporter permease [[Clostridium] hylemonae]EEG74895.1 iron chelate uptake ABC transporter, FeCT family, permease protein [[Clostridium] hylemonae DSM 15053]QEK18256.1 putative siderophore transport system permease protein YfiZ [[Clostridium] hylemonae DSM 15053]BDF05269.1 iron ABC transporter [[Clostridium] hylemonae]